MSAALQHPDPQVDSSLEPDPVFDALQASTIGEYEILSRLGRGGMASVYLAHDVGLDRLVALKVMHGELLATPEMRRRFLREARLAASLNHPRIVTVYGIRERRGMIFADLGRVEGTPLDELMRLHRGPLPLDVVRWLIAAIADPLHYAHSKGVVHRDVKPSNIIVDRRGDPTIADFGIAIGAESVRITGAGVVLGTPSHMSPEQCLGREASPASDQYSLGILAYELLTGRLPYLGTTHAVQRAHVAGRPPVPHHTAPRVPLDVSVAVMRMLERNPEDRWPSVADAANAIAKGIRASDRDVRQIVREQVAACLRVTPPGNRVAPVRPAPGVRDAPTEVLPFRRPLRRTPRLLALVGPALLTAVLALSVVPRTTVPAEAQSPLRAGPDLSRVEWGHVLRALADTALDVRDTSVARLAVSPLAVRLAVGDSMPLVAKALNRTGEPVRRRFQWHSDNPSVVKVGTDGWIRAVAPGKPLFVKVAVGQDSAFALVVIE